ncbi:MAG: hypothetical protein LBC64_07620 [Fibromonadaceae bacterium]|nr:hypothetical protein [Fibromonadaceae bacterium]
MLLFSLAKHTVPKAAKAQTLQAALTGKATEQTDKPSKMFNRSGSNWHAPSKQTNPQRCLVAFDVVPDF